MQITELAWIIIGFVFLLGLAVGGSNKKKVLTTEQKRKLIKEAWAKEGIDIEVTEEEINTYDYYAKKKMNKKGGLNYRTSFHTQINKTIIFQLL